MPRSSMPPRAVSRMPSCDAGGRRARPARRPGRSSRPARSPRPARRRRRWSSSRCAARRSCRCGRAGGWSSSCRWCRSPRRPGSAGVTSRGPSPRAEAAATRAAAVGHGIREGATGEQVVEHEADRGSRAPRARRAVPPDERARRRRRSRWPARVRTPSRVVPPSVASARAARSTSRRQNRWRCSDPGAPGWPRRRPASDGQRAQRLGRGVEVAGQREGHLHGRAGEVEVRALEDAHLAVATPGRVSRVSAGSLLTPGA